MIAYALKERVCFKINNLSSVLLITYLQLVCMLRLQPRSQVTPANQWTSLVGIPVAVEVLKAVSTQADTVLSFRTGKIASRLYGVTTGILGDTSIDTKDDRFWIRGVYFVWVAVVNSTLAAHKFPVSSRLCNLLCMAVPFTCWSLVWNLLQVTLLASRILSDSYSF
jgi:hypothetical protein